MRTNPNSLRYNLTLSWRSDICQNKTYGKFFACSLYYEIWVASFFRRIQQRTNNGLLYSHSKFSFFNKNHFKLHLYFYDGRLQERMFRFRYYRRRKFKRFYKWVKGKKKLYRPCRFFRYSKKRKFFLFNKSKRIKRTQHFRIKRKTLAVWNKIIRRRRFFSLFNSYCRKRWYMTFIFVRANAQKFFKIFSISIGASMSQFRGIQSTMIARYIVGALVNRFDIIGTVYRLLRGMMMNRFTPGLLVHCSGRFTRRQRKMYKRFQKGKLGIYKFTFTVDYFSAMLRQKYGACGIKVWLAHYQEVDRRVVNEFYRKKFKQITYRKKKFICYIKYKKVIFNTFWSFFYFSKHSKVLRVNLDQNYKNFFFVSVHKHQNDYIEVLKNHFEKSSVWEKQQLLLLY